jgi:hypothetical protein
VGLAFLRTRCFVGKAFADDTTQGMNCTRLVINAKRDPMVVAEVKFRQIAVQVLFGAVLIHALHARAATSHWLGCDRDGIAVPLEEMGSNLSRLELRP